MAFFLYNLGFTDGMFSTHGVLWLVAKEGVIALGAFELWVRLWHFPYLVFCLWLVSGSSFLYPWADTSQAGMEGSRSAKQS